VSAETIGKNKGDKRIVALLGIFFGLGFTAGFFTGFGYMDIMARNKEAAVAAYERGEPSRAGAVGEPAAVKSADGSNEISHESDDEAEYDSGLIISEHELGEDENGLFISGTIYNRSSHGYDAVRVTFDLCDSKGEAYTDVTDITRSRVEPGDYWGFTIYIPYSEMILFSSYRLQSIMGTAK
jgi:hypothetical protein